MQSAARGADVEGEAGERKRQRAGRDVRGPGDRESHRPPRDLSERCAARIVDVEDARPIARQHLEQAPLGLKVMLHVLMKIEVIARQVREDGGGEARPVDAAERQRMRRHFHRAGAAPAVDHFAEKPLHIGCLRCRTRRLAKLVADLVRHGAEYPAPNACRLED